MNRFLKSLNVYRGENGAQCEYASLSLYIYVCMHACVMGLCLRTQSTQRNIPHVKHTTDTIPITWPYVHDSITWHLLRNVCVWSAGGVITLFVVDNTMFVQQLVSYIVSLSCRLYICAKVKL